jgi:hypothetical protein
MQIKPMCRNESLRPHWKIAIDCQIKPVPDSFGGCQVKLRCKLKVCSPKTGPRHFHFDCG